jgi:uncharacterized FAD-dependent dehydrogenase
MQKQLSLRLKASEASDEKIIKNYIAHSTGKPVNSITGFYIIKRSVDARSKIIWINLSVHAFIGEPFHERPAISFISRDVSHAAKKIAIVGSGPAGLFAALKCIELGVKPVILERGKDVRARRRDLAKLNKEGEVNPESNYCFGEGGAGTYSDGKLYTRSTKRGSVDRILQLLVHFGADESILYESHPHIGTNKLPQIITSVRNHILSCGGEIHFEQKVTGLKIDDNRLMALITTDGNILPADAFILATGHSARDIFKLLFDNNVLIESKPFALGVRVEHPQELIDSCQYHLGQQLARPSYLPPASYSQVQQVNGRGVFSFCMCPGGIIAPAATSPGELVVNGWSPSKRNNPFANSGIVVQVEQKDVLELLKKDEWSFSIPKTKHRDIESHPLLLMYFQQMVEQKAFNAGGGKFVAPAQRLVDFTTNKISSGLPANSYLPGLHSADLKTVLPPFIWNTLKEGFKAFGKKMPGTAGRAGYYTNDAVVVATESRTSSPVRIPRNDETLEHPQIKGLYPCGEGGGYAGGIVSAAMDGERVATIAIEKLIS